MGKKILVVLLVMVAVAVVIGIYRSATLQTGGVENRVVRLEKLPANKVFKTSWNNLWVWVIPRSHLFQGNLHKQGKIHQNLSGPKNVFRSLVPDYFVFSTVVSKDQRPLLAAADDLQIPCDQFFLASELDGKVPENAMLGCTAGDVETDESRLIYYFDAVGQPLADVAGLGILPLVVPPQFMNSQRHLVIGRE